MKTKLLLLAILAGMLFLSHQAAAQGMKSPEQFASGGVPKRNLQSQSEAASSPSGLISTGFIRFFQKSFSSFDGPKSPSYPTGSAYGASAVRKYGAIVGTVLTADRLLHESDYYRGSYIVKYGVKRYLDPVEFNTYWWDDNAFDD